jgi:hypothetical protein
MVQESNDIGTAYQRGQMLDEPVRSDSLDLQRTYTDAAIADQVPDSESFDAELAEIGDVQRQLWSLAGDAVADDPTGTAPKLYVEAANPDAGEHVTRLARGDRGHP